MRAACLIEEVPKFWLDGALVRMEIRNGKRLAVKMDIAISWHAAMGALIEEWAGGEHNVVALPEPVFIQQFRE